MISDRVGILFDGVLQTVGTLDELLVQRDMMIEVDGLTDALVADMTTRGIQLEDKAGTRSKLRVDAVSSPYDVIDYCRAKSLKILNVTPRRETLEELFVRVVGAAEAARR